MHTDNCTKLFLYRKKRQTFKNQKPEKNKTRFGSSRWSSTAATPASRPYGEHLATDTHVHIFVTAFSLSKTHFNRSQPCAFFPVFKIRSGNPAKLSSVTRPRGGGIRTIHYACNAWITNEFNARVFVRMEFSLKKIHGYAAAVVNFVDNGRITWRETVILLRRQTVSYGWSQWAISETPGRSNNKN